MKNSAFHRAISIFLDDLLVLKSGERFLVYVDNEGDGILAEAMKEVARERGASAELLKLDSDRPLADVAHELEAVMQTKSFDAVCELSGRYYFYHTPAWPAAMDAGARLYSLFGMDAEALIRCVTNADHELMFALGSAMRAVVAKARTMRVTSPAGTDIELRMGTSLVGRMVRKLLRQRDRPFVERPSGMLNSQHRSTFLGGQLAFQGIPQSINGTAVVDGCIYPPEELGPLAEPLTLSLERGRVVEISGPSRETGILKRWLGESDRPVLHFCIGFHSGARLSGKMMEAERAFGCLSVGFGRYPVHTDGVITSPTIAVDGEFLEDCGHFIHPAVRDFEKRLFDGSPDRED